MPRESLAVDVGDVYPLALGARIVDLAGEGLSRQRHRPGQQAERVRRGCRGRPDGSARQAAASRPNRITVGVPCPGMYAPDVSSTWVRSIFDRKSSISGRPNSRFMNELDTSRPTNPARPCRPRQFEESCDERNGQRVLAAADRVKRPVELVVVRSLTVMYGGIAHNSVVTPASRSQQDPGRRIASRTAAWLQCREGVAEHDHERQLRNL